MFRIIRHLLSLYCYAEYYSIKKNNKKKKYYSTFDECTSLTAPKLNLDLVFRYIDCLSLSIEKLTRSDIL